ncbi:hypothetical protein Tco_0808827 [Tanacetum coccineum]
MVDSQLIEEEVQGAEMRDVGTKTQKGPTEPISQTQTTPSPTLAFIKENIDVLITMIKELDHQDKAKATPRKVIYVDSEKEAPDRRVSLKAKNHHTREGQKGWRTKAELRKEPKGRNPNPEKEGQNTKKQAQTQSTMKKFLEEFSQQKRYAKDPTEIHGIKRRQNESLQTFMDLFKSESSHIKGVPLVLDILAFMHGHGHPGLAKKLNEKIPKTVDEMFERVKAFIRGEMAAGSVEMVRPFQRDKGNTRPVWSEGPEKARNRNGPREVRRNIGVYTPYPRRDTFTSLTKTPKGILAMEGISFPKPPPLIGIPEKQNLNIFCDYHRDRGHNTNDCYQLKKHIKEAVASGKLAHLVRDIRRSNQEK